MCQNTGILYIFTCKCASRYSGVQFFDIATSKSAPRTYSFLTFSLANVLFATAACNFSTSELQKVLRRLTVFQHFHFQMCFSPQRRAIFRHQNFKKCSDTDVFFSIFTSKCAFRHSGVQFLISPLSTCLRTRRFNRPTFRLTRHTNH